MLVDLRELLELSTDTYRQVTSAENKLLERAQAITGGSLAKEPGRSGH